MPLITPPPPEPTQEEIIAKAKLETVDWLNEYNQKTYLILLARFNEAFNKVWANNLLTPQQVFDGYGVHATELVMLSFSLVTYINSVTPGVIPVETPKPLTLNQDGTVTVGA